MSEAKQKRITVTIKNEQLDALEDLLYCDLSTEKKEAYTVLAKELWHKLVKAYDKKKKPLIKAAAKS